MNSFMSQGCLVLNGILPVADFNDGEVYGDVVNMEGWNHATIIIHKGIGATGVGKLFIEPCADAAAATTATNVAGYIRKNTSVLTANQYGAVETLPATGYTLTAGGSQIYVADFNADALAASGYSYFRARLEEPTDAAVTGAMLYILSEPRYVGASHADVLS